jgi:polyhydroxybutyrate depolymerase
MSTPQARDASARSPRYLTRMWRGAIFVLLGSGGCAPCGGGGACAGVADGRYFAVLPDDWDGRSPLPALVHVHAWNSDPQRWLNDDGFRQAVSDAGLLLLLPEGIGQSWNVSQDPGERDDVVFIDDVLSDARARWPIDDARVYTTGHSVGAAVVHRLACERASTYRAFGPISGGFWVPMPDAASCGGPVDLLELHGTGDTTWPMEGRSFGSQGGQAAIEDTFAFWVAHDGCEASDAVASARPGMSCDARVCAGGTVELCLHDGLHAAPAGWYDEHLAFFQERGL